LDTVAAALRARRAPGALLPGRPGAPRRGARKPSGNEGRALVPRFGRIDGTMKLWDSAQSAPLGGNFDALSPSLPVRGGEIPVASTETRDWSLKSASETDGLVFCASRNAEGERSG